MIVPLRPTTAQHAIHRFLQHPLPELLHALPGEGFQRVEPKVTPPAPPSDRSRHGRSILCATVAAVLRRGSFLKECCVKRSGHRYTNLRVERRFTRGECARTLDAVYRLTGRAGSKTTRGLAPRSSFQPTVGDLPADRRSLPDTPRPQSASPGLHRRDCSDEQSPAEDPRQRGDSQAGVRGFRIDASLPRRRPGTRGPEGRVANPYFPPG